MRNGRPSTIKVIPSASRLVRSLRDLGYDFPQAVADLVDNSVAADAARIAIDLRFEGPDSWLRIADDGQGMGGDEITEAMRYSLSLPGKRIRPLFVLSAAAAVGADPFPLCRFALGLEMIHAYSLVHDDLPAMDDDDLRRGRPTNHRVFGEGLAILAGDGLLTEALAVMLEPVMKIVSVPVPDPDELP